jgi:hypothetical protein
LKRCKSNWESTETNDRVSTWQATRALTLDQDQMILKARMEHAEVTATPGEGTWTASAAVGDLKLSVTEETKKPSGLTHGQRT